MYLRGRVTTDEISVRRKLVARAEDDLDDHAQRGTDDERGETEDDGELRDVETTESFRDAARDRKPPPVENDEELDRSEDRARLEVP